MKKNWWIAKKGVKYTMKVLWLFYFRSLFQYSNKSDLASHPTRILRELWTNKKAIKKIFLVFYFFRSFVAFMQLSRMVGFMFEPLHRQLENHWKCCFDYIQYCLGSTCCFYSVHFYLFCTWRIFNWLLITWITVRNDILSSTLWPLFFLFLIFN